MRPRAKQLRSVAGTDGQVLTVQADNLSIAAENAAAGSASTGTKSSDIEWTDTIAGVTAPNIGSLGTATTTQDYPDASTTGQRFEWQVPTDYDSGDLLLKVTYRMSTAVASPNNVIRVETTAEIAKASDGTLDTTSYPATEADHTVPDNSINIVRETFLTITAGDFAAGDAIQFLFKRVGGSVNDLHTGDFRVITYDVQYTAGVAASALVSTPVILDNTDETPPDAGTLGNFDTLDFNPSVDNEQKFTFGIPDNWDNTSDIHITFNYAMSTAESAKFIRIGTEGDVVNVSGGTVDALAVANIDIATPVTTDITRSGVIRSISSASVNPGDFVTLKFARRGTATEDTHTGDMQLIGISAHIGLAPVSGYTSIQVQSLYLEQHDFKVVSASGVQGSVETPDFGGDFETYLLMESTVASGRMDVSFQGKLSDGQSTVSSIAVPIKGSSGSQYQLKVYVEGQGASEVYDSTLLAAPTSRTVTTLTSGDLSNQPTGEKRYFVVVEATIDNGESIRVGRPYVKQT